MTEVSQSHVEIDVYSVDLNGQRKRVDQIIGQSAYDYWCFWEQAEKINFCRKYIEREFSNILETPQLDKNLMLYLIIKARGQCRRLMELGSTLMEVIDGLHMVDDHMLRHNRTTQSICVDDIEFIGIEKSDFLSDMSIYLHPHNNIKIYNDIAESPGDIDIIFDRSVSSYSCRTTDEVAGFMSNADVVLANLLMSRTSTFSVNSVGHVVTYFSIADLYDSCNGNLYHIYGTRNPKYRRTERVDIVEGFFLKADAETAHALMAYASELPEAQEFFQMKNICLRPAIQLLRD